ncbi:hypothetical protein C5Y96_11330 [Blastopirellula marina]|uniref:Uncharacterized protein n=1 Tax=Blastopirellula marina TaxID=124 RepID=A0A2S8FML7_9BACT|nr:MULTISPECIES: hypothetical protein [Pirellulaceae]PQO33429.1 hypothetical protein C5Y96_11330 [Blastopirellula marina]RCS52519.1 hypothetical protein DTL36_11340 [Bremerella cremea]
MRLNWKLALVLTFALLLSGGCVSVRYDDAQFPTPAMPIACDTTYAEEPPTLAAPKAEPATIMDEFCPPSFMAGFNFHHRWKTWLHSKEHTPSVAPVIPPHSKFHPVPTRPVFAQPVTSYDDIPRPLPTKVGKPIPIPPPTGIPPDVMDQEANIPKALEEDLRIARPLSLEGPVRPIPNNWETDEQD